MPSIDMQAPAVTDAGLAQSRTTSALNRRSWLNALESAGLRDALRATKSFLAPEAAAAEPGSPASGQPASTADGTRRDADEAPALLEHRNHPRSAGNSGSEVDPGTRQGGRSRATDPGRYQVFLGALEQTLGADCPDHEAELATRNPLPAAPEAKRQWQARNVVVLPSEQGMEVWIRDSRLRESRLTTLLGTLRNTMAELGTSLVRVSLNGKPVQLHAQERPGERILKEG